jgi:hypothetical protein
MREDKIKNKIVLNRRLENVSHLPIQNRPTELILPAGKILGTLRYEHEDCCFLGCETMYCGRMLPVFVRTCCLNLQGRRDA